MAASQREQLIAAIQMYENDPDKSRWDTGTLRNMMVAAEQEGIGWQPHFSAKRAGMSLLDGLALGLPTSLGIMEDPALTRGERVMGGIGDIAGFIGPWALASKGIKAGSKAVGYLSGTGASSLRGGVAGAFEGAMGRSAAARTAAMGRATSAVEREMAAAGMAPSMGRSALEGMTDMPAGLKRALASEAKMEARFAKAQEKLAIAQSKTEEMASRLAERMQSSVRNDTALSRAVRRGADFGTAGAIYGGVHGLQEGDPLGGALGGAIGYGALGALGGAALTPALQQALMKHKLLAAGGAGALGFGVAANTY